MPFPRPNTSLYLRNLPETVRPEEVKAVFSKFGHVRDVYIPCDHHSNRPRGFAYVEFENLRDAEDAVYDLGRGALRLHGNDIVVEFAVGERKTPHQMQDRYGPMSYPGRSSSRRHRSRSRSRHSRRKSSHRRSSRSRSKSHRHKSGRKHKHRSHSSSSASSSGTDTGSSRSRSRSRRRRSGAARKKSSSSKNHHHHRRRGGDKKRRRHGSSSSTSSSSAAATTSGDDRRERRRRRKNEKDDAEAAEGREAESANNQKSEEVIGMPSVGGGEIGDAAVNGSANEGDYSNGAAGSHMQEDVE